MKLASLLLILYIAMIGILIFDNTINRQQFDINPYNVSVNNANAEAMWRLFFNPLNWKTNALIIGFTTVAVVLGVATAILTKSDISLLSPMFVIILLAGIIPIINIYQVLNREVAGMVCITNPSCTLSILLMAIIMGPVTMYWLWSCVDWWTQRQST